MIEQQGLVDAPVPFYMKKWVYHTYFIVKGKRVIQKLMISRRQINN